jgi:hypothetical protein
MTDLAAPDAGLRAHVSDVAFRWLEAALAAPNLVARVLQRKT